MNQMCLECKSKSVCKIVDIIKEFSDIATLEVTECHVKEGDPQSQAPTLAGPVLQPVKSYKNLRELREPIGAPKMPGLTNENLKPVKITATEDVPKKELKQCQTCEAIAFDGDVTACPICGKDTCDCCGTQDAETGKRLCEDCWGEN